MLQDVIFSDGLHLSTNFARPVAHVISQLMDVANDYWIYNKPKSIRNVRIRYHLVPENRITYHGCHDFTRSTSLACHHVHQMQAHSRIEIKAYDDFLCGILFWACKEAGSIFCHGKRTIRKNLHMMYSEAFFFRNFFNPLEPDSDGYFTLSSSYSESFDEEYTQSEEPYTISGEVDSPRFEIVDFLFSPSSNGVFLAALMKDLAAVPLAPPFFGNRARQIYIESLLSRCM